ncbi:hypothetical protein F4811DRAFT_152306 [Daldinia bambusicola]|nr:hypothetical protein F4811DRAFT_152306 [Daldinia bambusicola]
MATDSLKALITNIPDWLKRLEELNGQIDQRQQDLAMLAESQPKSSARSIRNKGSTESLKPRDESAPAQILDTERVSTPPPLSPHETRPPKGGAEAPSSPVSSPKSNTSLQRQTNEVMATAQRRARAVVRKKPKTESMMSNENTVQKYRSRNMIIVYYDSYVQSFFEELVKFVSMQRNAIRKAKMAAKVARIRRLAEIQMPDDEEEEEANGGGNGELKPSGNLIAAATDATATEGKEENAEDIKLRFRSTRQMGPRNLAAGRVSARVARSGLNGGLGAFQDRGDIWEELDQGLNFVQNMCEQAAHQFLRDGDCAEEIEKIKARLGTTRETADKELARSESENTPEEVAPWPVQSRSYRPTTMRKNMGSPGMKTSPKQEVVKQNVIEVEDEGVQDMDDYQPDAKPTGQIDGPTS